MEPETGEMFLILGGTVLLVYYGIHARRVRKRLVRHPPKGSPAYRDQVRRAFEAEFGLLPGELDARGSEETAAWGSSTVVDPFGTVVCPSCEARFRAGIPFCECCGTPTVEEEEKPDPPRKIDRLHAPLVCVFTTTDPMEATVVRSLLECHDIPSTLSGPVALNVYIFHRIEAATIKLMVLEPDAEGARRIINAAH